MYKKKEDKKKIKHQREEQKRIKEIVKEGIISFFIFSVLNNVSLCIYLFLVFSATLVTFTHEAVHCTSVFEFISLSLSLT